MCIFFAKSYNEIHRNALWKQRSTCTVPCVQSSLGDMLRKTRPRCACCHVSQVSSENWQQQWCGEEGARAEQSFGCKLEWITQPELVRYCRALPCCRGQAASGALTVLEVGWKVTGFGYAVETCLFSLFWWILIYGLTAKLLLSPFPSRLTNLCVFPSALTRIFWLCCDCHPFIYRTLMLGSLFLLCLV